MSVTHRFEPARANRLAIVRRLLEAIESGDLASERAIVKSLGRVQFREIYSELDRIAGEMHAVLCNVPVTDELARLAQRELPSARLRLNQVIDLTEEAAHQTLAAVEDALPVAARMATTASDALAGWPEDPAGADRQQKHVREVLAMVAEDSDRLRALLSDVMVAQGYQDLTGQIMRPVVRLVSELAATLTAAFGEPQVPRQTPGKLNEFNANSGHGPAVPGLSSARTLMGQQDVDDLMASLGL